MYVKIINFSKKYFLVLFIAFSLFLHLVFILNCIFYIEAKPSPSVYAWTNLITQKDLFVGKKPVEFPPEAFFSQDSLRRDYFPLFLTDGYSSRLNKESPGILPYSGKVSFEDGFTSKKSNYVYLWERAAVWPSATEEVIPYRAYVSRQGKIIFLYPEKLPLNSYESLDFQEYVRESALFLDDKFFWTKLEAVVK